jgi:putative transposase
MDILLQRRIYFTKHELAHLAADVLLLFASVRGCSLISGESLKTSKSTGRGKGVRGRWRILRYKSHLLGIRFRSERPLATSHTCPRCGKPADTNRSPQM